MLIFEDCKSFQASLKLRKEELILSLSFEKNLKFSLFITLSDPHVVPTIPVPTVITRMVIITLYL